MGRMTGLALGTLLLARAAAPPAGAQEAAELPPSPPTVVTDSSAVVVDDERALEFRTNVPWARLVLSGRQSIAGRSPLRVPGPVLGDFWLDAHGPGVELQRGRVRFSLDETGSRVFSYGGVPFRQNLTRSVVFPGLSQFRTRQRAKGTLLATLGATGIGLTLWAQNDYRSAEDEAASLSDRIAAETDPATVASLSESLRAASADAIRYRDRRNLALRATGVVWGVNLIDALVFTPRFQVQDVDQTSLTLSLRTRTRGRALFRSLVFPGLGQAYNGDHGKAIWVGAGGIAAASYLIWRQDDLDRADAGLVQAEARLAAIPDAENAARRDGRLRDVEDARRDRDHAVWIAAGYWGLSLLDTALSFQEPWGDIPVEGTSTGTVGWAVDPRRGTLAARIRF